MTGPHQTRNALIAVIVSLVILAVSLFVALELKGPSPESVQNSQIELRNDLVWSCTYEGNPLREIIQSMIREEIRSSAKIKASYFPDIPPAVLHRLIKAQAAAKRHRLKRAAPINCEGLFPPTP